MGAYGVYIRDARVAVTGDGDHQGEMSGHRRMLRHAAMCTGYIAHVRVVFGRDTSTHRVRVRGHGLGYAC
jgi:hypothetical protein